MPVCCTLKKLSLTWFMMMRDFFCSFSGNQRFSSSVWKTQPSARGISTLPTKAPSLPGYSFSAALHTDTSRLTGSPSVAIMARKFGSCMQEMRMSGFSVFRIFLSAEMRLTLRLSRDWITRSGSML